MAQPSHKGGIAEVSSYKDYYKLLYPQGVIDINVYGLNEQGVEAVVGSDIVNQQANTSPFIWGQLLFSDPDPPSVFSGDSSTGVFDGGTGVVSGTTNSSYTQPVEIDVNLSEKTWQLTTSTIGCDYLLSSVTSTVYTIPKLYAGDS